MFKGPIADSLVRKVRLTGGILSHSDLTNYSVKVDRALQGTYRGRKVYVTHAPTSGPGMSQTTPSYRPQWFIPPNDSFTAYVKFA